MQMESLRFNEEGSSNEIQAEWNCDSDASVRPDACDPYPMHHAGSAGSGPKGSVRHAAPGIDGVTWKEYETGLSERLKDLHSRVHRGTYRAQPSKRAYIPYGQKTRMD